MFKGKIEPDNVIAKIADWLPKDASGRPAYTESKDEFARKLEDESTFIPIGELVKKDVVDGNTSVETYVYDGSTPGAVEYHDRLQFFLVWYIDGARYIGLDDLKWKVFTTFKKEEVAGGIKYSFAGMLTMYEYYAWRNVGTERAAVIGSDVFDDPFVDNIRPRISQVFVMPPHQRKGHGRRLLQAAYDHCLAKKAVVVDIAVEEPSEGMVRLRDVVDVQNALAQIPDPATFFSHPTRLPRAQPAPWWCGQHAGLWICVRPSRAPLLRSSQCQLGWSPPVLPQVWCGRHEGMWVCVRSSRAPSLRSSPCRLVWSRPALVRHLAPRAVPENHSVHSWRPRLHRSKLCAA